MDFNFSSRQSARPAQFVIVMGKSRALRRWRNISTLA